MQSSRITVAVSTSITLMVLTGTLTACSGGNPVGLSSTFSAGRSNTRVATHAALSSPYIRTLSSGATVHVYPLPADRMRPLFADHVVYHGGPIVRQSVTYAIFWRPHGSFMDAKYEPVIEQFMHKVGDTTQYNILTQYYDVRFGILNASSFGGAWTDRSAYPSDFNNGNTGDADLHAEVIKAIKKNGWPHGGITPIYTIFTASQAPDDKWAACAYHGSFAYNGVTFVYAIVPYQHDYGPQGCGTPTNVWPNDRDADQTLDTYWHEQAEATSDPITNGPRRPAWYSDVSGQEIGDLCSSSYGAIHKNGADTVLHGQPFITQEMWSNFGYQCLQQQPY